MSKERIRREFGEIETPDMKPEILAKLHEETKISRHRRIRPVLIAAAANQLILGLLVNTLWICILNGITFGGMLVIRVTQCAIMLVLEFAVITALSKVLNRMGKERFL